MEVPEVRQGDHRPSPSPTVPPLQCASTPEDSAEDPNATQMWDPEVVQLNQFIRQVTTNTEFDPLALESYYCMDCSVRESVIFGQE